MGLKDKKAQITIASLPSAVIIVGLIFLVMAVVALISQEYSESLSTTSHKVWNETTDTSVNETGVYLAGAYQCNSQSFAVVHARNASLITGATINTANFSISEKGRIKWTGTGTNATFNNTLWNVTYTYSYSGVACNVTTSLQEEVEDNTSIAGILLTMVLIGAVLTILIGVFLGLKSRRM